MIVRELAPPYRSATLTTVLHVFDVAWLREKGELTVHDDHVLANGERVAVLDPTR